eukprot:9850-Heterococcus_DN1.PRE.4
MLLTRKFYAQLVCTQCSKNHEVRVHYEAWAYAHFAYQSYYRQLRHLLRPCTLSHSGHADVENFLCGLKHGFSLTAVRLCALVSICCRHSTWQYESLTVQNLYKEACILIVPEAGACHCCSQYAEAPLGVPLCCDRDVQVATNS